MELRVGWRNLDWRARARVLAAGGPAAAALVRERVLRAGG